MPRWEGTGIPCRGRQHTGRNRRARKRREKERENEVVRIQAALTATVDVMSAAVELRDPYTAGHQLRVTIVARAIAEQMGLSDEAIRAVEVAGRVHDLGKLRIPAGFSPSQASWWTLSIS